MELQARSGRELRTLAGVRQLGVSAATCCLRDRVSPTILEEPSSTPLWVPSRVVAKLSRGSPAIFSPPFRVEAGKFLILVEPSSCAKRTLLLMENGLTTTNDVKCLQVAVPTASRHLVSFEGDEHLL